MVSKNERFQHLADFGLGLPVARRAVFAELEGQVDDLLGLRQPLSVARKL
jgi:hypothetical protein